MAAIGASNARAAWTGAGSIESPEARQLAHLEGMIGAAGAFYTAFAVTTVVRLLERGILDEGALTFVPWLVPIVGASVLIKWWKRRWPELRPSAETEADSESGAMGRATPVEQAAGVHPRRQRSSS